jgi:pimeloyl-ACP methyl ester carboxylesterase
LGGTYSICIHPAVIFSAAEAAPGPFVPNASHAINLEDPAAFNRHIEEFLHAVDVGAWRNRDPRAMSATILGEQK